MKECLMGLVSLFIFCELAGEVAGEVASEVQEL